MRNILRTHSINLNTILRHCADSFVMMVTLSPLALNNHGTAILGLLGGAAAVELGICLAARKPNVQTGENFDPNDPDAIQQALFRMFDNQPAELEANRQGKATTRQRLRLLPELAAWLQVTLLALVLLVVTSTNLVTMIASGNFSPFIGLWHACAIAIQIDVLYYALLHWPGLFIDVLKGQVSEVEGIAWAYHRRTDRVTTYWLSVNKIRFPTSRRVFLQFVPLHCYQIFYFPHAGRLASASFSRKLINVAPPPEISVLYETYLEEKYR